MQEKVYQTHVANIDDLKHLMVQMWAELTSPLLRCMTADFVLFVYYN